MTKKCCCCEAAENREPVLVREEELIADSEVPEGEPEAEPAFTSDCSCRTKHRSDSEMKDLIHRLNRIEGQIRGIRAMVEEERYCVDILTQVSAARSALNSFNRILLEQHIRTCVVERIESGDEEVVDELCGVVQKLMK